MKSKLFSLGKSDWLKALIMSVVSTAISVLGDAIMQEFTLGNYSIAAIHWKEIGAAVLVATISYLKKNLFSNSFGEFLKKEEQK